MRSPLDVRLGEQVPQIMHAPPDVGSLDAAEEAIELADAYGICDGNPLAESQQITLRGALGERPDGTWAASRVADFGPRQGTGKTDSIAGRELAGLILFGERLLIHTAHEMATAKEAFRRFEAIFTNWDDLRRRVNRFRYSNEEQGVELLTGQRLIYKARSGKGARGFAKADLVVYDEAQHLGREHLAASAPAKLANPNSQTWYAGSGGLTTSAVAWAIRRDALGGNAGRLAYTEHTAERVRLVGRTVESERPDPADLDAWYQAMPGLGRWVTEESMRSLFEELGPEEFARECLCVWDPDASVAASGAFPAATWDLINRPDAAPTGDLTFGIDVNPERSSAAIIAVGAGVLEVIEHRAGTSWLVGRCRELDERWGEPWWAIDGRSSAPIASMVPELADAELTLVKVASEEMPAACGLFFGRVVDERIAIRRHPSLDAAVEGAEQKSHGDAWTWSRTNSSVDISPLVAATVANWVDSQMSAPNIH